MKLPLLLTILILTGLVLPVTAESVTASLSSGTGSPEIPLQEASAYINSTRAAVSERNWSGALLLSAQGIAYYPDNADLICLQAYTYRKMGQYSRSVELVTKAIALDPKAVRYANRGYGYLALGNNAAALADAENGVSRDPGYTANYAVKALALQDLGRNPDALDAISQALAREPGNAHYWHVEGILLAKAGNCSGAKEALEHSISIDPDYALPYPGFTGAREHLAALNTSCIPAPVQASTGPQPTKSPLGWMAAAGTALAACIIAMRR